MSATLSSRLSDVLNVLLLKMKMSQSLNVFKVKSVNSDCPVRCSSGSVAATSLQI
jgi:hypothetical protein